MKTIIAGCRDITDYSLVQKAICESGFVISEVVSGAASGVDSLAIRYAKETGLPLSTFPADWKKYGKSAGPRRNRDMAEYADALIAIWDGVSRGTKNMIDEATKRDLNVHVLILGSTL